MPSDRALKVMNTVNRMAQRLSRGRFGWELRGMPVLEVTTTGRKSGQRRTTLLTSPLQVDDGFIVVASRGGDDVHPAWFLNLRDDPEVMVAVQGHAARPMHAHIATPAERADLWPRVTARHPHYAGYQERTDREIPLVVLAPDPTR
ncbi:deazaflavin-dependent oxidoreductase (nitroreductase family) [Cryobacterium mesophilum]|uniref:Nitroreductase family deazaflavin-dependent oxidoreductase n=1 Tax=Terrimesophilobacter mesophilus TaxID=433647 RepID=A0A4R8VBJ2_9MICO|nr:nitroreductase/quinone reductase family protein [Terrimesophilobacter mesophilus]MBB5632586.1 deazaflavin-dependent oxidoreductase (nitroreductase family) [Terrimesophilobacter mesophilus]TFB79402.1 nitroreductase family deazaflavin-dependent oxidoreductase [Terrimesophilobacter mesophilus]